MNPCLSEKSRDRSFGAPFLLLVWDRKTDPAPLRCARITRPMAQNLKRNHSIMVSWHSRNTTLVTRCAFQLAHLNLMMPLEMRIYYFPTHENIECILRRETKKNVIVNFLRRIRLECGGSTQIIRASEILSHTRADTKQRKGKAEVNHDWGITTVLRLIT